MSTSQNVEHALLAEHVLERLTCLVLVLVWLSASQRRSARSLLYEPGPELLVGAPVSGVSVNRNTRIEMRLMCVCEEEGRERTAPARRLPGARRTGGRRTCARKERLLAERLRLARACCEYIHVVALKEVEVGFDCVHRRRVRPEGNGSSE